MNAEISPEMRNDISLENWRFRPHSCWSFQNASEIVPSATITANKRPEAPLLPLGQFDALQVTDKMGGACSLPEFLTSSETDCLVIMRDGNIIAEWVSPTCDPLKPHLIFSISKSITGLLAGWLVESGQMSLHDLIDKFIPEVKGSAFEGANIEQLLGMSVALNFDESYLDREGQFDRYRRVMQWNPDRADDPAPNMLPFLCTLEQADYQHGKRHVYRSPVADMAGILLERVSGERYADFMQKVLWQPLGAHSDASITVDRGGAPRASGGISMTTRDLARVGEMMRQKGNNVAPETWVDDIWNGGCHATWLTGEQCPLYPQGSYRHYWYTTGFGALAAMGIHGQWLWIDQATGTVIARSASEKDAIDNTMDTAIVAMMRKICAA